MLVEHGGGALAAGGSDGSVSARTESSEGRGCCSADAARVVA